MQPEDMPAASASPAATEPAAVPLPDVPVQAAMNREFILRHQIVERYLAGRLPPKGVQDFERFCADNPTLLDELGLPAAVNAALRLLEAGGRALPWEERPRRFWEKPYLFIGVAVIALALGATALFMRSSALEAGQRAATLEQQLLARPVDPVTSTRAVTLVPSRTGPSRRDAIVLGSHPAQLAEFRIDMRWSRFNTFRVTIDRVDQGRVAVLHNVVRDSNGQVQLALNTSALGPGSYQLSLEGLNLRNAATPQAWVTIGIAR